MVSGGDRAAMGLDNALANRHAQTGSGWLGRVKGLEQMSGLLGSEPWSVISHFQTHHFFVAFAIDLDANGTFARLERIEKQVTKQLFHSANVDFHIV